MGDTLDIRKELQEKMTLGVHTSELGEEEYSVMDTATLSFQNTVSLSDLMGKVRGGQGRMAWQTQSSRQLRYHQSGGVS